MRFSLQFMLVIVWIAGGLVALDVALYERFSRGQALYVCFIVMLSALLGQYAYRRRWAVAGVPKIGPSLLGIVCVALFFAAVSYVFGSTTVEICTRSQMKRTLRSFGLLRVSTTQHTKNSRKIRDVLKYVPHQHNWKFSFEFGRFSASNSQLSYLHPLIVWNADELGALNALSAEQIQSLFELDSGYDVRFAGFRKLLYEKLRALIYRGAPSSFGTLPEAVREWYNVYSMFLSSFRSPKDVQNALRLYRGSSHWQHVVDDTFCNAMKLAGIPIPTDVPVPAKKP